MKSNSGFTLIELIIVIVIMAIVSTVTVVSLDNLKYTDSDRGFKLIQSYVDETRSMSMEGEPNVYLDIVYENGYWWCAIRKPDGDFVSTLKSDKIFSKEVALGLVLNNDVYISYGYSFNFDSRDGALKGVMYTDSNYTDISLVPKNNCFLYDNSTNNGLNISVLTGRTSLDSSIKESNIADSKLLEKGSVESSDLVVYKDESWVDDSLIDDTESSDNENKPIEDENKPIEVKFDDITKFGFTHTNFVNCNPYETFINMSCHIKSSGKILIDSSKQYKANISQNNRGLRLVVKSYDKHGNIINTEYLDNADIYKPNRSTYCIDILVCAVDNGKTSNDGGTWHDPNNKWNLNGVKWYYDHVTGWNLSLIPLN